MTSHVLLTDNPSKEERIKLTLEFHTSLKIPKIPSLTLPNRRSSINVADTLPDCHNSKSHLNRSDVKQKSSIADLIKVCAEVQSSCFLSQTGDGKIQLFMFC